MIAAASEVVLLADQSKFGHDALVRVAPLDVLGTIVTSPGVDPIILARLRDAGIEVVIADPAAGLDGLDQADGPSADWGGVKERRSNLAQADRLPLTPTPPPGQLLISSRRVTALIATNPIPRRSPMTRTRSVTPRQSPERKARVRRLAVAAVAMSLLVGACSSGATPATSGPSTSDPSTTAAPATPAGQGDECALKYTIGSESTDRKNYREVVGPIDLGGQGCQCRSHSQDADQPVLGRGPERRPRRRELYDVKVDVAQATDESSESEQLTAALTMVNQDYDAFVIAPITNANLSPAIAQIKEDCKPLAEVIERASRLTATSAQTSARSGAKRPSTSRACSQRERPSSISRVRPAVSPATTAPKGSRRASRSSA